ncbi:hypothetical protein K491DRAFT_327168 [Lophiostoma macrostomum CBS 122681]|uniref:Uncharacterized protein n=1 Tax=Lophiostoma macrostomum CBS 122681 TaxID=1314788 RepID=A0A6A6TDN4_9PLEO|nr:hypothetical protein K491DRAFT_327168 [Lophiostoma macrostomum CBS 122681]
MCGKTIPARGVTGSNPYTNKCTISRIRGLSRSSRCLCHTGFTLCRCLCTRQSPPKSYLDLGGHLRCTSNAVAVIQSHTTIRPVHAEGNLNPLAWIRNLISMSKTAGARIPFANSHQSESQLTFPAQVRSSTALAPEFVISWTLSNVASEHSNGFIRSISRGMQSHNGDRGVTVPWGELPRPCRASQFDSHLFTPRDESTSQTQSLAVYRKAAPLCQEELLTYRRWFHTR